MSKQLLKKLPKTGALELAMGGKRNKAEEIKLRKLQKAQEEERERKARARGGRLGHRKHAGVVV